MKRSTRTIIDDVYKISLFVKGFDGAVEVIGGLFLLLFPAAILESWLDNLVAYNLVDDPHNFIRIFIVYLDKHYTHGLLLFAGLYLVAHGAIKIFLAVALLKKLHWAYPIATVLLTAFILYQAYEIGYTRSPFLAVLTAFDIMILILVQFEYGRLKRAS